MKLGLIFSFILVVTGNGVFGDIMKSSTCPGQKTVSDVGEVRVSPCVNPSSGEQETCKLKRGTTASISVDFVPKEEIPRVTAGIAWVTFLLDFPFPGLESDACKSLTPGSCPLHPGANSTWTAEIKLSSSFPLGTYPLKLKLTDANKASTVAVCQLFTIALVD